MAKFNFPRHPGVDRPNPFEDESGQNPFGDEVQAKTPADEKDEPQTNPYVARQQAGIQPYHPGEYETFLPHRGRLVFWTGVVGFTLQLLGMVIAAIAIFAAGEVVQGIVYGLPGSLAGLAVSIPAWVLGHTDRRAMESGAMQADGNRSTMAGMRFGMAGTMLAAVQLLFFFGLVIYSDFFA